MDIKNLERSNWTFAACLLLTLLYYWQTYFLAWALLEASPWTTIPPEHVLRDLAQVTPKFKSPLGERLDEFLLPLLTLFSTVAYGGKFSWKTGVLIAALGAHVLAFEILIQILNTGSATTDLSMSGISASTLTGLLASAEGAAFGHLSAVLGYVALNRNAPTDPGTGQN